MTFGSAVTGRISLLCGAGAWAVGVGWRATPRALAGLAGLTMVRGFLPVALALTARGLINGAITLTRGGAGELGFLLPWLVSAFGLAVIEALLPLTQRWLLKLMSDDILFEVTSDVLSHATALDMASLEDAQLRETMERVQESPSAPLAGLITELQDVAALLIQ